MDYKIHEIGKKFYLLRSDEPDFHRNIYLKVFEQGSKRVNMLMDPGSRIDLEPLSKSLEKLIGGIEKVNIIFLSHQDPDVSSATPAILAISPRAVVLSSQDTIRLVKMYGIPSGRILAVENFKSETVQLKETSHKIKFIPAYFCHFRGAMMLYDLESKVLFTGDFMGGLNTIKDNPVYATEEAWEGIAIFHSIYMPSNLALRETVNRIGLLHPFPEVIAPQHGYVVRSELIVEFLNRLSELNVGLDLLTSKEPEIEKFILALNDLKDRIKNDYPEIYSRLLQRFKGSSNFTSPFLLKGDEVLQIKIPPSDVIRILLDVIEDETSPTEFPKIKTLLVLSMEKFGITQFLENLTSVEKTTLLNIKEIFAE